MTDLVRQIANAVLYEGHVLYPYRLSALKNQQRWTFGGVYPAAYARTTADRARVAFQCLVEGEAPRLELEVRFLQILHVEGREHAVERSAGAGEIAFPPLQGLVETRTDELRSGLHRLSVSIENTSPWADAGRAEVMLHTFASTHAIARARGGAFVSPLDTAEPLVQEGLWPVLVGEPPDRSTVLASPIILSDYPRVAPESPGETFDGGEIDGLLALSVLALSDAEKREVRAGDPRARELLDRTEALTPEQLLHLHGAWREP